MTSNTGIDMERNKQLSRIAEALEKLTEDPPTTVVNNRGPSHRDIMAKERAEITVKTLGVFLVNIGTELREILDQPYVNPFERAQKLREIAGALVEYGTQYLPPELLPKGVDYHYVKGKDFPAWLRKTLQESHEEAEAQGNSESEGISRPYRTQKVWEEADGSDVPKGPTPQTQ